jgi:hypothetical protein
MRDTIGFAVIMINALIVCSRSSFVRAATLSRQTSCAFAASRKRPISSGIAKEWGNFQSPVYSSSFGTARFASSASTDKTDQNKKNNSKKKKKQKWTLNPNIGPEHAEKLAAAFDELARKEGFDSSLSHMVSDATFEDDFTDEDFFLDDDDEDDDDDEEDDDEEDDDILDSSKFNIRDFEETKGDEDEYSGRLDMDEDEDEDDEYLDMGADDDDDDDMDARIAAARKDMAGGRVTVPEDLDRFSRKASADLEKLGFKKELNPFGDDETPRKNKYKLISNAKACSACGSDFQSRDDKKAGFLPSEKFEIQQKLVKIEEMQQLKEKAETREWSAEDEIEFLIHASGSASDGSNPEEAADIDISAMAAEMGLDLVNLAEKRVICKRCHGLQNSGTVEESLRPGWTDEPTMSQEKFRDLLKPISEKPAVLIALIDLFDFSGSVLRELDGIAGENPVILAANKADLLPSQLGKLRAESWVRRELEYLGVKSIANVGGAVRLISCKTGSGVLDMLGRARKLADEMDCDVYIVGAANAGKSTMINYILGHEAEKQVGKVRAGNKNAFKGALTTSPLPGTTLKFIKVDIGDGKSLYDTPGLLVPGTLTQILTPEELKIVVPKK